MVRFAYGERSELVAPQIPPPETIALTQIFYRS